MNKIPPTPPSAARVDCDMLFTFQPSLLVVICPQLGVYSCDMSAVGHLASVPRDSSPEGPPPRGRRRRRGAAAARRPSSLWVRAFGSVPLGPSCGSVPVGPSLWVRPFGSVLLGPSRGSVRLGPSLWVRPLGRSATLAAKDHQGVVRFRPCGNLRLAGWPGRSPGRLRGSPVRLRLRSPGAGSGRNWDSVPS